MNGIFFIEINPGKVRLSEFLTGIILFFPHTLQEIGLKPNYFHYSLPRPKGQGKYFKREGKYFKKANNTSEKL